MKTYRITKRPINFDHPFQISIYNNTQFETGRLGNSVESLIDWAETYISETES